MKHGILIVEFTTRAGGAINLPSIRARVYRGRGGAGFTEPGATAIALLYSQIQAARQARGELAANEYSEARVIPLDAGAPGAVNLADLLAFATPISDREFRRRVEDRAALDLIGGAA